MRITDLEIDGFGVWRGLRLEGLSEGLSVFYGPNEAGKTTLLQFIRSVLYGFSDAHRSRYLPPLRGGRPGGTLVVETAAGRYRVSRHDENGTEYPHGHLTIVAPDGTRHGDHQLKSLLAGVDEPIFNNVFALGLRELQELGTLSDAESARQLYNLTTGLDRVSLVDVLHELATSRNRILASDDRPSQVAHLLGERERLRREMEEAQATTHHYIQAARERDQLAKEIARLEKEVQALTSEVRLIETASKIGPRWQQRASLEAQLAALGDVIELPEGALEQFDELSAQLEQRRQQVRRLKRQRSEHLAEAAALDINEPLWRQGPRIEALADHAEWIDELETQVDKLQREIRELEAQSSAEGRQLGLPPGGSSSSFDADRTLTALRPAARAMREAKRRWTDAQAAIAARRQESEELAQQLRAGKVDRSGEELTAAMERAGNLVSQLRRRVQLDERLEQLQDHRRGLEEQNHELLNRQLLPGWTLAALGLVFVFGVALILAGLFLPASITGPIGWALVVLGIVGAAAAGITQLVLDRSAAQQLEICQQQLGMVTKQIKSARDEREKLDKQLPRGGGPLLTRLQEAERELAALEELVPLDGHRSSLESEVAAAEAAARQARKEMIAARKRWRQALTVAGLPVELSPKQVRHLAGRSQQLAGIQRRLEQRRSDLQLHQRSLNILSQRVAQLIAETGLNASGASASEKLKSLQAELDKQEALVARRDELYSAVRQLRREQVKVMRLGRRLLRRRRDLLRSVGALDERQFRARALEHARLAALRSQYEALQREIEATLEGSNCDEQSLATLLAETPPAELEARWEEAATRLTQREKQLQELFESRGELNARLKVLADDRTLTEKQLEYASVEARLNSALERWQVLGVTHQVLDSVRDEYERDRQPETLQEASGYLARLTRNRYRRVWTPLDEDVLRVDDADGNPLPVEVLSRGTREQLFLSLRLALCTAYARRGTHLPLVLDDVLVNFDATRAKAAASVLRDFASQGHQLLVFTCHEHIFKMFKSLKADVRQLPDRDDSLAEAALPRPRRTKPRPEPAPLPEPEPLELEPVATIDEASYFDLAETTVADTGLEPIPFAEADTESYSEPAEEVAETTPAPVEPVAERPKRRTAERPRRVRVTAHKIWSAEGAEDFAGEFFELPVEVFEIPLAVEPGEGETDGDETTLDEDALAEKTVEEESLQEDLGEVEEVEDAEGDFVWEEVGDEEESIADEAEDDEEYDEEDAYDEDEDEEDEEYDDYDEDEDEAEYEEELEEDEAAYERLSDEENSHQPADDEAAEEDEAEAA